MGIQVTLLNNNRSNICSSLLPRDYGTFRPKIFDFFLKDVLPKSHRILDPMAGTAPLLPLITTAGVKGHFNDILPSHYFINKAKTFGCFLALRKRQGREKRFLFREVMRCLRPLNRARLLVSKNWIHDEILSILINAWEAAEKYEEEIGTILRAIILMCVRPYSCFTSSVSNHTWLKMGGMSTGRPLEDIVKEKIDKLQSFYSFHYGDINIKNTNLIEITCKDATLLKLKTKFDTIFTSPPYPNRFDARTFSAPELFFLEQAGYPVKSNAILGTPQVKDYLNLENGIDFIRKVAPSTLSFLMAIINKSEKGEAEYYPRFFVRYYSDLFRLIQNCARFLKNNGAIYMVVQNNIHRGELNEMPKYLTQFFELAGYETAVVFDKVYPHLGTRNISAKYPLVIKKHIESIIRAQK